MNIKKRFIYGFSIIEMMIVVCVITILSFMVMVSYEGVQERARDASVRSDVDTMDSLQTNYGIKHKVAGRAYYSGTDGSDDDLDFVPSEGNIIDVVVNATDYCIRGYNVDGIKNSISNAITKESSPDVCSTLSASALATGTAPASPSTPVITVTQSGSNVLATTTAVTCATGTPQYGINSRTNDGNWSGWTVWSTTTTDTQSGSSGIKYGYKAQARCYVDDSHYSATVGGVEYMFVYP